MAKYPDPRCRRKIHERIKEGEKKKANGVLIVIESPLMTYGFTVLYDRQRQVQKGKFADRRDSSYGLKAMPVSVIRIDDRYLAQRNIPKSKTLAGKNFSRCWMRHDRRISVDMLVKAGAGTCGGKAHVGGFRPPSSAKYRASSPGISGLAVEQGRGHGERTQAFGTRGRDSCAPCGCQAGPTGRAGLAHRRHRGRIPRALVVQPLSPAPMLSVWIEGPGTAVRALLRANPPGACYRCLWHSNRRGELRSTVDSLPTILAGHGCEGLYVPFPLRCRCTQPVWAQRWPLTGLTTSIHLLCELD